MVRNQMRSWLLDPTKNSTWKPLLHECHIITPIVSRHYEFAGRQNPPGDSIDSRGN
jgi:hypothetical protein